MLRYLALAIFFTFSACSGPTTITPVSGIDPCVTGSCGSEASYCSSVTTPADPVTLSGSAYFQRRTSSSSGLSGVSGNLPIRHAELVVLNASGSIIQCGETDDSGNFSVDIERTTDNVRVEVRSRANNSKIKVSVLDDIYDYNYYKIQSSLVSGNTNQNLGSLIAPYNSSLEGGAFNILDRIFEANEFLRDETDDCHISFDADCVPFSVAPKLQVFWAPGVDPGAYVGAIGISFYLSGSSRLFILGGDSGNVNSSDTDHFDESVILHEYGHFLEDIYAGSDSPGGYHDADSIIDPRLAWSEGWATYFALSVQVANGGDPVYRDTFGNSDGVTGVGFDHNLDTNIPKRDPSEVGYLVPDGEGIFREFGIVRALLDATDAANGGAGDLNDLTTINFYEFWTIFAGAPYFPNSSTRFRNASLFFEMHNSIGTDLTSDLEHEYIFEATNAPFGRHYASIDQDNLCASTASIRPKNGNSVDEDGSFENSNLFSSNDFYQHSHAGGALSISLNHDGNLDLNLFLYPYDYSFGEDYIQRSINSGSSSESISVGNLAAGTYMVNVMVNTAPLIGSAPGTWPSGTYTLTINGNKVCPP